MEKLCRILLSGICFLMLTACSVWKTDQAKIRDIEFTVLNKEEIPEEFLAQIEEKKSEPIKLSYGDKGYLYVARGYGTKEHTGYSVEVSDCYETEDTVCVKTSLLGPDREEEILKKKTYPFVVIKMEYTDKQVIYD